MEFMSTPTGTSTTSSFQFMPTDDSSKAITIGVGNLASANTGLLSLGSTYSSLRFRFNATDTVTFLSDGNVGIGDTAPSDKLVVNGRIRVQGTNALAFGSAVGGYAQIAISGASTGNLTFTTWDGAAFGERMRITLTGNVGIGTTAPAQKLHVDGSIRQTAVLSSLLKTNASGDLIAAVAGTDYQTPITNPVTGTGTATQVAFWNSTSSISGDSNLYWDNTNKFLGIGTSSPTYPLDVAGSISIGDNLTGYAEIMTPGGPLFIYDGPVGYLRVGNFAHQNFITGITTLADGNESATLYLYQQKVGIGTTSPSQKLHVVGNAYVTGAYYDSTNSPGTSGQVLTSTATGTDWKSLSEITGVDGTGTANYVAKWSDTDTITTSTIYDDGTNVGVGIATPGYKLHVEGTGYYKSTLNIGGITTIGNASDGTIKFSTHATNFGYITGGPGVGGWDIGIGTSNAITIVNSGGSIKVGIKKLNPQYDLDLDGTVNSGISRHFQQVLTFYNYNLWNINTFDGAYWIQSTSPFSTPNYNAFYISLSNETVVIGDANTYHTMGTPIAKLNIFNDAKNTSGNIFLARSIAGSDQFVIKDNGNVGIGTTAPITKLDVRGGISFGDGDSGTIYDPNGKNYISYEPDFFTPGAINLIIDPTGGGMGPSKIGYGINPASVGVPVTTRHIFGNGDVFSAGSIESANYINAPVIKQNNTPIEELMIAYSIALG
jgi:hypothetical protein